MARPSLDSFANRPSLDTFAAAPAQAAPQPQMSLSEKLWHGISAIGNAVAPGAVNAISNDLAPLALATDPSIKNKLAAQNYLQDPTLKQNVGGGLELGSLIASAEVPGAASVGKSAAQYALLSGGGAAGTDLATGKSAAQTVGDTAIASTIGAGVGTGFNLLGKALSKASPSVLSFTSGVPKAAIEQASANPEVSKQGVGMTVENIRHQAVGSLQSLYRDLGTEFKTGLDTISQNIPEAPNTGEIPTKLLTEAQSIASKYKVATKATSDGLVADFSKSAIVKGGEETAVQKALDTLNTWTDYSPKGMQDLEARIGALRNFESGAQTRSSAIVGQIYNSINSVIKDTYPQLAELRTQYGSNKQVLDEISNVLSATKDKPISVQSSINRLSNIFNSDREQYINIIKQLGDRSGVDYLSLLSGTEFQRVLPDFIRGLGGGAAVGVGSSILNPYLLLLAPLFSPRIAGVIARNAPGVASSASAPIRTAATQAIQKLAPRLGQLLGGQTSQ